MAIPATQAQGSGAITEEILKEERLEQEDGVLVARLVKYSKHIAPDETKARINNIFQGLVTKAKDCLDTMRADPVMDTPRGREIHQITAEAVEGLERLQDRLREANLETALAVGKAVATIFDDEDEDDDDEAVMNSHFNNVIENFAEKYGSTRLGSESVPHSISYEDGGVFVPASDYKIIVTKEPKVG
jgi:hypothetical protein